MAEYIKREDLIEWLKKIPLKDLSDGLGICRVIMENDFKSAIKTIPESAIVDVADVSSVRHGRWDSSGKYRFQIDNSVAVRCTECGCSLTEQEYRGNVWNYCPVCGANMDGDD